MVESVSPCWTTWVRVADVEESSETRVVGPGETGLPSYEIGVDAGATAAFPDSLVATAPGDDDPPVGAAGEAEPVDVPVDCTFAVSDDPEAPGVRTGVSVISTC